MKPAPFRYERPDSVEEALAVLVDAGDDGRILAGGQSLVPMLNMRLAAPGVLVDINRIPGLDGIATDDGWLVMGTLVRQRAAERSRLARSACPLLAHCLPYVGHVATRNRGTVGGSMAHADPAAELPLVLAATGGDVDVVGPDGTRRIPAGELFAGFLTTSLRPGEMVVACRFPVQGAGAGSAFVEAAPRYGDFAYASVAALVSVEEGTVTAATVAVGAAGDRPLVVGAAGAALVGTGAGDQTAWRAAADVLRAEVHPSGSLHAPADYQRHLLGVLAERAVGAAVREATTKPEDSP